MTPFDLFPFGHKTKDQPKLAPLEEHDFEVRLFIILYY